MDVVKGVPQPPNRAARRAWLAAEAPPHEPHPAPEVPGRLAEANEIPGGAKRLVKAATDRGWRVRVTYSRGTTLTARGGAGKLVDCVVMVGWRPAGGQPPLACRWWASWIDGGFEVAYSPEGRRVGYRELRNLLERPAGLDGVR